MYEKPIICSAEQKARIIKEELLPFLSEVFIEENYKRIEKACLEFCNLLINQESDENERQIFYGQ